LILFQRLFDYSYLSSATSQDSSIDLDEKPQRASISPPPPTRQAAYFATGALVGSSTIPIELALRRLSGSAAAAAAFVKSHGPTLAGRAGVRFWTFDIVKTQLNDPATSWLPIWAKGGLGGAAGRRSRRGLRRVVCEGERAGE